MLHNNNNQPIKYGQTYDYRATTICEDWDHHLKIRYRIETARATYLKNQSSPILIYERETWTLTEAT